MLFNLLLYSLLALCYYLFILNPQLIHIKILIKIEILIIINGF